MTVAFTLCCNNYLAQAKVAGESFRKHHPNIEFVIGLVDKKNEAVDYTLFSELTILPVADLSLADFAEMERKYSIVELNTAVKPFYFEHLFRQKKASKIIYLDPDTETFSAFNEVLELLERHDIIITPQNCTPIDDGHSPSDIHILGTGIFNLGFIALADFEKTLPFLKWWQSRLVKYSFADERNNMFFDQVWINLVPVFFDNYYILKHRGYNMAPSNLHERQLAKDAGGKWLVNRQYPLRFYHYSGFRFSNPQQICVYSERYTFASRPDIVPIHTSYIGALRKNEILRLQSVDPLYCRKSENVSPREHKIKRGLNRISRALKVLAGKN